MHGLHEAEQDQGRSDENKIEEGYWKHAARKFTQ